MHNTLAKVYKEDIAFKNDVCWIEANNAQSGEWAVARKEFEAKKTEPTILTVCAPYYAEAYVNGVLAARFCERSYMFAIEYKAVDISKFVKEGNNTLAIIFARMGNSKTSALAMQITEGENTLLVSNGDIKTKRYDCLSDNTDFFISGNQSPEHFDARKDVFAPAFVNGFDDSAWENANVVSEDLLTEPFDSMHQGKGDMQTNIPLYAKEYSVLAKSKRADGKKIKISAVDGKTLLCEAKMSLEDDGEICVKSFGGAEAVSVDGKICSFDEKISVCKGEHRFAVAGGAPNLFISGKGIEISDISKTEVEVKVPERKAPVYPWNDIAKPYVMSDKTKEYLEVATLGTVSNDGMADVSDEMSLPEQLKEVAFIKCTDSVMDKNIDAVSQSETSEASLGILGRDTIFGESGEMKVSASENDVTFILDFGVERIGGIFFDITAAEGTEITFNAFEAINDKGISHGHIHQIMRYTCKEGSNEYISHARRGLRYLYVSITAPSAEVVISKLGIEEWRYPAEDVARFECSDERLNEIYKMSLDTAKVCMLDAYVDCPGYEQNTWTGDARVTALVNLCAMGSYDFNVRYLELIAHSVEDGLRKVYRTRNKRYIAGNFLSCACFPTYPEGTIPVWSYMWSLALSDHYRYTGDKEALKRALYGVEANLERSLKMSDERGLFAMNGAWNLIEWASNDICEYGEVTANNMMLSYCFAEFAKIESELGNEAKAKEYAAHAERIKEAVNKYCWSEERGAYVDTVRDEETYAKYLEFYAEMGKEPLSFDDYMALSRISAQTNTFAVLYGIAEGERKEKALNILVKCIESGVFLSSSPARRTIGEPGEAEAPNGIVHVGSPFFMYFVLETLFENGYADLALHSIKREWGNMLDSGCTTCLESFNTKTEWRTRSVAHAWSASPAIYLITELLGIRPTKPGFTEFEVVPCDSKLDFAKGSIPTPYGEIKVEWNRNADGNVEITCAAPKECVRVK